MILRPRGEKQLACTVLEACPFCLSLLPSETYLWSALGPGVTLLALGLHNCFGFGFYLFKVFEIAWGLCHSLAFHCRDFMGMCRIRWDAARACWGVWGYAGCQIVLGGVGMWMTRTWKVQGVKTVESCWCVCSADSNLPGKSTHQLWLWLCKFVCLSVPGMHSILNIDNLAHIPEKEV